MNTINRPAIQALVAPSELGTPRSSAKERAVFAVSVTGFTFAIACSQLGMLETGTNTELANTSGNRTTKPADWAASGPATAAWGLVPLFRAAHGAGAGQVGLVAAIYPGVWSVAQIATGHWSDTIGRKPLIVAGMLLQAAALAALALSGGSVAIAAATAAVLGLGTALVYPTLIAAISDAVSPVARAPVVGVYRFWRDLGYALGAVIAGAVADAAGYGGAIGLVAALTAASGIWVLGDMPAEAKLHTEGRHAVA
jgi:MFS family permease